MTHLRRPATLLAATLVAALAAIAPSRANEPPCEFEGIDRIVAVGDVHGAYDRFVEILQTANVIDDRSHWSGGQTHLVQVGDVLDRGPNSRKALDLLQRLEREAAAAGGGVHALLGNHEAMRLLGDLRYVTLGEYTAFATSNSEELRRQFLDATASGQRLSETPLGLIEMTRAFGPTGPYGSFLRRLNAVEKINGILFLHGGISPAVSSLSCAAMNATIRRELSADPDTTRDARDALTNREDGPLWYRGLAREPDSFGPQVDKILAAQQARAIVVGHTVAPGHRVLARFGGKVILIDTGMQPKYIADGRASALEIRGGVFTAIYRDGREVIVGAPAATARMTR